MSVRIGILGSGFVADFYMTGLRDVPAQEVVINYSQSQEHAADFAERWGIDRSTTSMEEVIDRDVDLVLIALPNHLHQEAALLCAERAKNMVCTKPLGRNAAEARSMLDAATDAGVMHGYAETEVFAPAIIRARQFIDDGSIGRVLSVRSREAHSGPHSDRFWDIKLTGGGALMDMGCHCIAAARYFIGKDVLPVETVAWGDRLFHEEKTEGEDSAVQLLRFENGALATIEVSWIARGGMDLRNEVYGTEGTIFTDVTRGSPVQAFVLKPGGYLMEKAELETGWVVPVPDEARAYGYQEEMRYFVECVREQKTPRETFEDGWITNVILDAAYKSMASKTWEPIKL